MYSSWKGISGFGLATRFTLGQNSQTLLKIDQGMFTEEIKVKSSSLKSSVLIYFITSLETFLGNVVQIKYEFDEQNWRLNFWL